MGIRKPNNNKGNGDKGKGKGKDNKDKDDKDKKLISLLSTGEQPDEKKAVKLTLAEILAKLKIKVAPEPTTEEILLDMKRSLDIAVYGRTIEPYALEDMVTALSKSINQVPLSEPVDDGISEAEEGFHEDEMINSDAESDSEEDADVSLVITHQRKLRRSRSSSVSSNQSEEEGPDGPADNEEPGGLGGRRRQMQ